MAPVANNCADCWSDARWMRWVGTHATILHPLQLFHTRCCAFKLRLISASPCWCRLVIAHQQFDPYHTALGLLPLLAPSRPFVIWCTTLQPLAECAAKLQREPYVLNLQLCDTMSRPQQVRMPLLQPTRVSADRVLT